MIPQHPSNKEWEEHLTARQEMKRDLSALVEAGAQTGRIMAALIDRLDAIEKRLPEPAQEQFSHDLYRGAEVLGMLVRWTKNTVLALAAFIGAVAVVKAYLVAEWELFMGWLRR
jgi:hypothetical protein